MADKNRCRSERKNGVIEQLGFPATLSTILNLTPTAHKERCMKMDFFVDKQKELCAKYDKILPVPS
ncbi:hypothetical protein YQE_06032, partial [Dendroctonus ponderosae]